MTKHSYVINCPICDKALTVLFDEAHTTTKPRKVERTLTIISHIAESPYCLGAYLLVADTARRLIDE